MDYIDISVPVIEEVAWNPNPVPASGTAKISVKVTEVYERLYPLPFASGEIAAGEA